VVWLVEANVSEKRNVTIFRAEVTMLGIRGIIYGGRKERSLSLRLQKMEILGFAETSASTNQSTRRPNPEEHQ
jgi:hypothetical protein